MVSQVSAIFCRPHTDMCLCAVSTQHGCHGNRSSRFRLSHPGNLARHPLHAGSYRAQCCATWRGPGPAGPCQSRFPLYRRWIYWASFPGTNPYRRRDKPFLQTKCPSLCACSCRVTGTIAPWILRNAYNFYEPVITSRGGDVLAFRALLTEQPLDVWLFEFSPENVRPAIRGQSQHGDRRPNILWAELKQPNIQWLFSEQCAKCENISAARRDDRFVKLIGVANDPRGDCRQ